MKSTCSQSSSGHFIGVYSFIPVMSSSKNAFWSVLKIKNSQFNPLMQRPKYSAINVLISWLLMSWRLAGSYRLIYILSKMFRVSTMHIESVYWSWHSGNICWKIHCTFALYSYVPSVLWVCLIKICINKAADIFKYTLLNEIFSFGFY